MLLKQIPVVSVGFGLTVSFSNFFKDNDVDPNEQPEFLEDDVSPQGGSI